MFPLDGRLLQWQGAPQRDDDPRPGEDYDRDGCPGGWPYCAFAVSFDRYRRRRLADGAHDINPRITPDTPEHILDALTFFEHCEAVAEAEFRRQVEA